MAKQRETHRYKLLQGIHAGPALEEGEDFHTYRATDLENNIVTSDRPLDKMFQNKFEKMPLDEAPPEVKAKRKNAEDDEDGVSTRKARAQGGDGMPEKEIMDKPNKLASKNVTSKLGENVSEDFPKAAEADLLVLKKGRNYQVADSLTPDAPVSEKPMGKGEVNKFLSKYLKK